MIHEKFLLPALKYIKSLPAIIGPKLLQIIIILILGELGKRAVNVLVNKVFLTPKKLKTQTIKKQEARLKTLTNLVINTSQIVINFVVFIMILSEIGIDITPLLTGAGILGLAVGWGAKSLVSDIISGFFMILENQFNVGDEVEVSGNKGQVTKITLRTLTLKDEDKKTYIIPNSNIKYLVKYPKKKKKVKK